MKSLNLKSPPRKMPSLLTILETMTIQSFKNSKNFLSPKKRTSTMKARRKRKKRKRKKSLRNSNSSKPSRNSTCTPSLLNKSKKQS
jgi:hypothetical protein